MKKAIWLLILAAALFLLPVHAAETPLKPVIAVETVTAEPTETVTVPVTISGNPGFAGISHVLYYDPEVLSLQTAELGELLKGKGQWAANTETPGIIRLTWFDGEDTVGDGTLFCLEFTVAADAPLEASAITLNGADTLIILNAGEQMLPSVWKPGNITVVEPTWHPGVQKVETSADGKSQTITLQPFHRGGETRNVLVVAAAYDAKGRQLAAAVQSASLPAEQPLQLPLTAKEAIDHSRVFLLDAQTHRPVCVPETAKP